MRIVQRTEQFAVIDDVLSAQDFERVNHYAQVEDYGWLQQSRWVRTWRLSDGNALASPRVRSDASIKLDALTYPTGADIDLVIARIFELGEEFSDILGKHGEDWIGFSARSYMYPAGTGLSWHTDGDTKYPGAYIYYAHAQWNVQWGGELLLGDSSTRMQFPDLRGLPPAQKTALVNVMKTQQLDPAFLNNKLLEHGIGHYVLPKPNRLVILGSGTMHALKKVEPAAGDHVRQSIAGFFVPPALPD